MNADRVLTFVTLTCITFGTGFTFHSFAVGVMAAGLTLLVMNRWQPR